MNAKAESEQLYRCKTVNCSKSFKNASSLFRHNKCCVDFIKGATGVTGITGGTSESPTALGGQNVFKPPGASLAAVADMDEGDSSSSDGEIHMKAIEAIDSRNRDANLLCEPEGAQRSYDSLEMPSEKSDIEKSNSFDEGDLNGKKMKKQVILNPSGKTNPADTFTYDDLIIDEAQAAKLESYSCYAGVPQRDKAGKATS